MVAVQKKENKLDNFVFVAVKMIFSVHELHFAVAGEVQQLQWELSRRNIERDALNSELATLTLKVEDLSNKVQKAQALNESLSETQTRYDALLQMYGEKMEENQELRLDLEDVKEMYKSQIDQLVKRQT